MLNSVLLVLTKTNRVFVIYAMKIAKLAQDQTITTVSIVKLGLRKIIQAHKSRLNIASINALPVNIKVRTVNA